MWLQEEDHQLDLGIHYDNLVLNFFTFLVYNSHGLLSYNICMQHSDYLAKSSDSI
jgi:hypothetical protein